MDVARAREARVGRRTEIARTKAGRSARDCEREEGAGEQGVREWRTRKDPFWEGCKNLSYKFLRNAGFYLTTRNPSLVQLELVLGI